MAVVADAFVLALAFAAVFAAADGTDPWLIGLIAASAAITGAIIAGLTADWRQKRELEHDRERQKRGATA